MSKLGLITLVSPLTVALAVGCLQIRVLWWLTVGAVKGFALYLGLATVLDLVATYFFMGPLIRLLARTNWFARRPVRFGLPASGAVSSPILGAKAT